MISFKQFLEILDERKGDPGFGWKPGKSKCKQISYPNSVGTPGLTQPGKACARHRPH